MTDNTKDHIIEFTSPNRRYWITKIASEQEKISNGFYYNANVVIKLAASISKENISPVHLVTLACLEKHLMDNGCNTFLLRGKTSLVKYFREDLHLREYFYNASPHETSKNEYTLNLWRVDTEHTLMYSQHLANYLKRNYFNTKDLTILRVVLDELYANIADHSEANGVAYSFISFDRQAGIIRIAFCDFGIGIKGSLSKTRSDLKDYFIKEAIKKGVSAKSNTHNKGFGLDTVVSCVCSSSNILRIVSGKEFFIARDYEKNQKTVETDFDFKGTLIYFDIPISAFEDADVVNDYFEL